MCLWVGVWMGPHVQPHSAGSWPGALWVSSTWALVPRTAPHPHKAAGCQENKMGTKLETEAGQIMRYIVVYDTKRFRELGGLLLLLPEFFFLV